MENKGRNKVGTKSILLGKIAHVMEPLIQLSILFHVLRNSLSSPFTEKVFCMHFYAMSITSFSCYAFIILTIRNKNFNGERKSFDLTCDRSDESVLNIRFFKRDKVIFSCCFGRLRNWILLHISLRIGRFIYFFFFTLLNIQLSAFSPWKFDQKPLELFFQGKKTCDRSSWK